MTIENQLEGLVGVLPEGVTEGVALGTGIADGYDIYQSPVGDVAVTFNPEGVSSVGLADTSFERDFAQRFGRSLLRAEAPSAWKRHIPTAIEAGTPGKLPVDLGSVSPFQTEVLLLAAAIPRGEVRSYGWLAHEASKPGAARAVGTTMASNPVPLIIPCHRVVRADGHLGAYSLGGVHNKWELLEHEGADPSRLEDLAGHHIRVQADSGTKIYHHPTCRIIRSANAVDVVGFRSMATADAASYHPCEICRPCC